MKIPKPKKLPSGNWRIQLRLGGQSISVNGNTERAVIRDATAIKAEYKAGRLNVETHEQIASPTVEEAVDKYIDSRCSVLSPSTLRGYTTMSKNRWRSIAGRKLSDIGSSEWQHIVNEESKLCSAKTLKNAWGMLSAAIRFSGGQVPKVTLPQVVAAPHEFLQPEQIPAFIEAVKDTRYAVPLLLALSSLRISEIYALDWRDIPAGAKFIRVSGAVVPDAEHHYIKKAANKNVSSARNVPLFIPELREAIERERKPRGCVSPVGQQNLRIAMRVICEKAGLPNVGIHGLRHSFASLCYHLQVPEQIAMEIGGWSDAGTMRRIYTHVAQSDLKRYEGALTGFFSKNAHKNAHEAKND